LTMVVLEIDMGDTRSKWRLREGKSLLSRGVCASEAFPDVALSAHPLVMSRAVEKILVAAVCEEAMFERAIDALSALTLAPWERVVTTAEVHGLSCVYINPSSMGVDRWLAMLAAYAQRDPLTSGLMVVSCGTAVTIDFVRI